ncbi:MAG: exodeoxyribonuclease VII large subunit [Spirochaetaceae bacterium]|jgi:exodeoxyribonuclease VII large subunit|nr:exodeoxyribonuclease VII large subunit [Spirochaetaceae bacterium]
MDKAHLFSVSELTERIRANLEGAFAAIHVEGEVSNYRPSSTGHLYFTLKDAGAAIGAVMFKNRRHSLGFEIQDGMLLRARGSLSVYGPRGTYQLVCETLELAGAGALLALLEQRKRALAAEGLFNSDRKKPIPRFPAVVAVVSSPTGAAVRDILTVLQRRAAGIRVIILPAPVQGAEAAPRIVRRIEQANAWHIAQVIILGRGGGSLEDLLPFSEETVVRAVAASRIPIISAVGHEIDWALSDFAADLRAPTPSAAAELVSASWEETRKALRSAQDLLYRTVQVRLERIRLLAKPFKQEDLEYRFRAILQPRLVRFDDAKETLLDTLTERIVGLRRRLELARRSLEAASPEAMLKRGFSLVIREADGKPLRRAGDLSLGDRLIIRPWEGRVTAETLAVDPAGPDTDTMEEE